MSLESPECRPRSDNFVYCASYETSFALLNWNISYISGHIRLETGCSFIKMHERTASWIVIEGARRRQRRLLQLTIPDQGISTLNFLIMLILLFWSQKLKRHLLLQAYINMQRWKKRFIFAFWRRSKHSMENSRQLMETCFFDPSNVRSCWQKDWFLYCTRTKFQRFLTIFFHSIESKTTAW